MDILYVILSITFTIWVIFIGNILALRANNICEHLGFIRETLYRNMEKEKYEKILKIKNSTEERNKKMEEHKRKNIGNTLMIMSASILIMFVVFYIIIEFILKE